MHDFFELTFAPLAADSGYLYLLENTAIRRYKPGLMTSPASSCRTISLTLPLPKTRTDVNRIPTSDVIRGIIHSLEPTSVSAS